jgi:hypothetical protein
MMEASGVIIASQSTDLRTPGSQKNVPATITTNAMAMFSAMEIRSSAVDRRKKDNPTHQVRTFAGLNASSP